MSTNTEPKTRYVVSVSVMSMVEADEEGELSFGEMSHDHVLYDGEDELKAMMVYEEVKNAHTRK